MQSNEFFRPGTGAGAVTLAAGLAALAAILWFVGWHYAYAKRRGLQIELAPVVQTQRERWISTLQSIRTEDLRELHQLLSRTMREILGKRAGRDLSTWTVSDLRASGKFTSVCGLLESWEQPAFGPVSQADAEESVRRAVEEVSSW